MPICVATLRTFSIARVAAAAVACVFAAAPLVLPAYADAPPATRPADEEATQEQQEEKRDGGGASGRLSGLLERMQGGSPATRPADDAPSTRPANGVKADGAIRPGDLIRQMREQAQAEQAKPLVAQVDLSIPVSEQEQGFSLFSSPGLDLRSVLSRLDDAAEDDEVKAVLVTLYNGGQMNFAQAQEVRQKLDALRRAGKRTFAYADTYDTVGYHLASACTDVVLMEGGELFIPGIAVEPMFYRGALDKLGVTADYVQVGEFKGAEEPFTRSEPSPELAGEFERLVEAMYDVLVSDISQGRGVGRRVVEEAVDRTMTNARLALAAGLIDHVNDADGLRDLLADELGADDADGVRVDASYGLGDRPRFDPDNPLAILQLFRPAKVQATQPSVALIYAEGAIVDGSGGGGLFGGGVVNTQQIREAMRLAARDDNVKAVVLRIDSPGGSALASEAMYQAIRRVADDKPVIVSIGGIAASGGYYLAVAGDEIYADPAAIIGSIGVVGGKLVLDGLYDKVGLTTATFSRGRNAALFSQSTPWDDRQRRLVRTWMRSTYDQFTDRVQTGRGDRLPDVDRVARGRIFLAREGKDLGMVDVLGGLDDALDRAAARAELGDDYEVIVLPGAQANPFAGAPVPLGAVGVSPLASAAAELASVLPAPVRRALQHLSVSADLLDRRPVILMAPFVVHVR